MGETGQALVGRPSPEQFAPCVEVCACVYVSVCVHMCVTPCVCDIHTGLPAQGPTSHLMRKGRPRVSKGRTRVSKGRTREEGAHA